MRGERPGGRDRKCEARRGRRRSASPRVDRKPGTRVRSTLVLRTTSFRPILLICTGCLRKTAYPPARVDVYLRPAKRSDRRRKRGMGKRGEESRARDDITRDEKRSSSPRRWTSVARYAHAKTFAIATAIGEPRQTFERAGKWERRETRSCAASREFSHVEHGSDRTPGNNRGGLRQEESPLSEITRSDVYRKNRIRDIGGERRSPRACVSLYIIKSALLKIQPRPPGTTITSCRSRVITRDVYYARVAYLQLFVGR